MIKYLSFNLHIPTTYHPRSITSLSFFYSLFVFNRCTCSLYTHWFVYAYIYIPIEREKEREKERENRLWLLKTISFFLTLLSPSHTYRDTFSRLSVCVCRSFFSIKYLQNNYRTRNRQTFTDWWNREKRDRETERKTREKETTNTID